MEAFDNDGLEPFRFSNPKVVSQKVQSQVVLCDAFDVHRGTYMFCVLKFFPPKAKSAYERELAVYSAVARSAELQESVPLKLWSGIWTASKYREFIGKNLTKALIRKSDRQISVIALPYINNTDSFSNVSNGLRLFLAKAALYSLRRLHANRITHGDVSACNLLIQRENRCGYTPYWIDFSSSTVGASIASITHEWQKAVEYFSDLVRTYFCGLTHLDKSRALIHYAVRRISTGHPPTKV